MSLNDKVALVTGGGRGIGAAVSCRLARMGATVAVNFVSRPENALETVANIIAQGGKAEAFGFDVAHSQAVDDGIKKILEKWGRIDVLVNNAGITRDGLLVKMKDENWDSVMNTNLKGTFNCVRAVARTMMKQRWGRIINVSSVIGFAGNAGQINYAAAKAGMVGLTRAAARELASRGITVNGIAPGYIETDMTKDLSPAIAEKILKEIPLGTLGNVEDVAGAVAYLVSEDGRYVTGQFIHVNGGMFMG